MASSSSALANDSAWAKGFSGENEDGREYKRWKTWVKNKFLTLDKLPEASRGAYIYTLLSGKALEAVEHLEPESYQKKEGDALLWSLLDKRFPQQEVVDELGEILGEVFGLKSHEGENMKQWTARASELFDRCHRKTGVQFPDEARGWLLLHRAGLSEEQKAVVIARARGDLKRESVSAALRSCYPDLVIGKRRTAVAMTEDVHEGGDEFQDWGEEQFSDVEQFLEDHLQDHIPESDVFPESEVAEVLAASWRERRQELSRLPKTRQFQKAKDVRRSFRVEVEELKKHSTCNRCGKKGHWARECRSKDGKKGSGKGTDKNPPSGGSTSGAAAVEELDFVASIMSTPTLLDRLRGRCCPSGPPAVDSMQCSSVLLVSSPGYGVLDSGCGRTIIGAATLRSFEDMWRQRGWSIPDRLSEVHQFKFGNGAIETSHHSIQMPVALAGKRGVIRAAIIKGDAPLLLSRAALKRLGASLDFGKDCLRVFDTTVPLQTNSAGQYVLSLMDEVRSTSVAAEFTEVMALSSDVGQSDPLPSDSEAASPTAAPLSPSPDAVPGSEPDAPDVQCWTQEDSDVVQTPWVSREGPKWKQVIRRIVRDSETRRVLDDTQIVPGIPQHKCIRTLLGRHAHVITEFWHVSPSNTSPRKAEWKPSAHQHRQLKSQVKVCCAVHAKPRRSCLVMEVFSPPRFALENHDKQYTTRSYDLSTGYDFRRATDRKKVEDHLTSDPPELLVLSPPCTNEGGWFNLNRVKWDPAETARRMMVSRSFIRWCCKLFRLGVELGCRVLFEHPTGARTWSYPEMQRLCQRWFTVKLHMCRYGLQLPGSDRFIRKSTRLLVSHEDMQSLGRLCDQKGEHSCHDIVAGGSPGVGQVSTFAGAYPKAFVRAVLNTIPMWKQREAPKSLNVQEVCNVEVVDDTVPPTCWPEVLAAGSVVGKSDQELIPVLTKLHRNLGHPPNNDLVRILRHGQASDQAIRLAREFSCDLCRSRDKPKVPLPAQTQRSHEFNGQIALDVKHLKGWQANQKVKALNIVDSASGFQRMIPFFETETATVLRKLLYDHWLSWAGTPKEIILDPAKTNLGDPMVIPAELDGVHVRPIAAGAHWQLGKCESHGGWFNTVLEKLIDEFSPNTKDQWLECVTHAHVKNQQIQVHGFSPHQFVFGKNPHIPQDLLNEPLLVVPATASLTEDSLARSQAMRTAARMALVQMQDDRALRVALLARPRVPASFGPGDLVAYWRNQKWINGQLQNGGQWYGVAVVLGQVGRNLVLVHRRQILRCAPEQVRHATNEEKCLIASPQTELLGIKDMIEKGNLMSKQYIDLLPQSYPPQEGPVEPPESMPERRDPVAAPKNELLEGSPEASIKPSQPEANMNESTPVPEPEVKAVTSEPSSKAEPETSSSSYGPVRRRIERKDGPMALWRPAPLKQDDFVELIKEVIPQLVDDAVMHSAKRPLSPTNDSSEPEEPRAHRPRLDEALSVQEMSELREVAKLDSWECLMQQYLHQKVAKELPHSNNPPDIQKKVQDGKKSEWDTIQSKPHAVKIHYGKAAERIRVEHPDRFIGSRFVLTRKPLEEGQEVDPNDSTTFMVKGRWCLQGHLDPDLTAKAEKGMLKSPTLSQIGRQCLMQTLATKQWQLQLGDIKGAFLEAGPLDDAFRPLFASQPPGGIPGLPAEAVIEVVGNVYGQNDAPAAWFKEFSSHVLKLGWHQSVLDPCLFMLRHKNQLVGVMGVHVDDTAVGGSGPVFEQSIRDLRNRFPYRKWRTREGEFCGAWYKQGEDWSISMCMSAFSEKIRSINIPKQSASDQTLSPSQVKMLRAVNGSLNWLSSQSRPDLSVQTSLSQQAFPNPRIEDLRTANQAIRRAKQHSKLGITFQSIQPEDLTVVCHSDAAFANRGNHTQAGYIIGFTEKTLQDGLEASWCPASWRSYKLPRAVSSTLSAESQALSTATGTVEWILLMLSEIFDGPLQIRTCREVLKRRQPIIITDCKSLYDHVHSPSAPSAVSDRRTSIDIIIIKESCKGMGAFLRWVPTNRMLADGLTKNEGDPVDLLRACIRRSSYQISPEETVLEYKALEKELRKQAKVMPDPPTPSTPFEESERKGE